MRTLGVNYDTGLVLDGDSTRTTFDEGTVRRELEIIAGDLHATAVRVSGDRVERLELAARHASAAGLQVWFSPFVYDLDPDELVEQVAACAQRAELLCSRARSPTRRGPGRTSTGRCSTWSRSTPTATPRTRRGSRTWSARTAGSDRAYPDMTSKRLFDTLAARYATPRR
jgi:hypothetical protein